MLGAIFYNGRSETWLCSKTPLFDEPCLDRPEEVMEAFSLTCEQRGGPADQYFTNGSVLYTLGMAVLSAVNDDLTHG